MYINSNKYSLKHFNMGGRRAEEMGFGSEPIRSSISENSRQLGSKVANSTKPSQASSSTSSIFKPSLVQRTPRKLDKTFQIPLSPHPPLPLSLSPSLSLSSLSLSLSLLNVTIPMSTRMCKMHQWMQQCPWHWLKTADWLLPDWTTAWSRKEWIEL